MGRSMKHPKEVVIVKDEHTVGCGTMFWGLFILAFLGTMLGNCGGG